MEIVARFDPLLRGVQVWRGQKRGTIVDLEAVLRCASEPARWVTLHLELDPSRRRQGAAALVFVDEERWRVAPAVHPEPWVLPRGTSVLLLGAPPDFP